MKHSLITLAAAVAAFMLGCQDPGMTDPVATGYTTASATIAKPHPVPDPNLLAFDQTVMYTNIDGTLAKMRASGYINFQIDQVPILRGGLYDVQIAMKGEIRSAGSDAPIWSFGSVSTDRIRILDGTKVRFAKSFSVAGAPVPTVLNVEFIVTEKAFAVGTMTLTSLKGAAVTAY